MELPEVEPPSESSAPIKSRPARNGIDWEALEAAQAARFVPLPLDATDDEVAARSDEIDASNQLPGRMVPYMDRWNGRKWVVWKERWITDEDLAAFTKKPSSASVSTRAGRSELRPAKPPTITTKETVMPPVEKPPIEPPINPPVPEGMPEMDRIRWESKQDGAVEAWFSPNGTQSRAEKTYLGRLGKKKLAELRKLPSAEFSQAVAAWIAEKMTAKGLG